MSFFLKPGKWVVKKKKATLPKEVRRMLADFCEKDRNAYLNHCKKEDELAFSIFVWLILVVAIFAGVSVVI